MTHGSLPFTSAEEAVSTVLRFTPEIPSWPQLPRMGIKHNMIVQFAHDIPGIAVNEETKNVYLNPSKAPSGVLEAYYEMLLSENPDRFALDEEHFPGLFTLAKNADRLRLSRAVKGQMSGPVTMGLQILGEKRTPVLYEQTEMELLLKSLRMKAKWQQGFLRRLNANTIIFFDEPGMALMGSPCVPLQKETAIGLIEEALGSVGGAKGIHCCGNTDWSALLETSVDILSFDAYNWGHTIPLYSSSIESFLSRGGKLAWGIVPTLDESIEKENVDSLMTRFQEGLSQLTEKGIDVDTILDSSFITPACGLGLVSPANAAKALSMTRELSMRLRKERELEG
jgi:hypothetical protein